jgi:hypothetical protein
MDRMLTDTRVKGYLYFCPLVITYTETKTVDVPDPLVLEANLMLPAKGSTDTPYTVKDITVMPKGGTFQSSKLEVSENGGQTYTLVSDWPSKTKNASMEDSKSIAKTYKYRLTVYLTDGTSDTDEKSIDIEYTGPQIEIEVEADLLLPEYTWEGHTEIAEDASIFTVTDETGKKTVYSAVEAYRLGIATNSFSGEGPSTIGLEITTKDGSVIKKSFDITEVSAKKEE